MNDNKSNSRPVRLLPTMPKAVAETLKNLENSGKLSEKFAAKLRSKFAPEDKT